MKKILTSLLVSAFLFLLIFPVNSEAGIQFGIRGGGNASKLTGADIQNLEGTIKYKVGLVGGIFFAINIGKIITIEPEFLYTMKGSQEQVTAGDYTKKLYGDYLEIPVLLKLRIPTPGIQPAIFAGPSVGFKLKEKLQINGQDVPLQEKILENNDYGAIFGAGLDFGRHFMIDIRYSLGLKKVLSAAQGTTALDVKNGVWSATVGIAF
ncbi:MAG: PorT family protein [Candidatus Aminicenantes bacterium]|nr:PorT family protein [Candidatus Aminicenantes bacterium]